jgi:REP element-mobilizing transposase RayT
MAEFTVINSDVDLSQPAESARGRYGYNLHVVLITEDRFRITDTEFLRSIRDGCLKVAAKKGHLISRLSVMPDHLHIAMRPGINDAPLDIIYAYQNNLAYLVRQQRIWCDGYYVGTFGEYTTRAVHRLAGEASRSGNYSDPPSAQDGWGRRGR